MAAISTLAAWKAHRASPYQPRDYYRDTMTLSAGRLMSNWTINGATPGASAVPSRVAAGALGQPDADAANDLRLLWAELCAPDANPVVVTLCDRLVHSGGLAGNVATAQTTNLPSTALTRYTTGVGVFAAIEVFQQIGTTGTTFTVSYTDDAGNTGQTSPAAVIGAAGNRELGRFIPIPLLAGDKGVRAVASVTLAATTGTAGNIGVVLWKPLQSFVLTNRYDLPSYDALLNGLGMMPVIEDGASLFYLLSGATSTAPVMIGRHFFAET